MKLTSVIPTDGSVEWIKPIKSPSVTNWIFGNAIAKIRRVMTIPKIPSVSPISLLGSMSMLF